MQLPVKFFKVLLPPSEPAVANAFYLIQPDESEIVDIYITDQDGNLFNVGNSDFILGVMAASMALKANLASPAFTGEPTAPTADTGTDTTQIATCEFVVNEIADNSGLDADLESIGAINSATAGMIASIGAGWVHRTYSQIKTLLGLVKADVGLGSVDNVQQLPMSYLDTDPTLAANSDAKVASQKAMKSYADAISQGLQIKAACRVATTANISLSGTQTIDGVSVIAGDRVLVKNQSTASQNGIYICAAGSWSRATDADASSEVKSGMFAFIEEGTTNADSGWVLTTNNPITLGSTSLSFTQFSGAGQITDGNALTKTGNTLDVNVDNSTIEVNSDALRIKDAGVSLAKMANMATASILGRNTAGTGVPEVLSAATVKALLALGTSDSPNFTGIELGHASDTTLARIAAGIIAVEGETLNGYAATATASGTTTLTVAAAKVQMFTGSSTQTVKLPTTGVVIGQEYVVVNTSTGLVTVQSSGANDLAKLGLNQVGVFTALQATPTSAAHWIYRKFNINANANGKRVVTVTQSATPAINTNNGDIFEITGLAQAITSLTTNLTGSPVSGDMFELRITDNGTGRAITAGASFGASTVALPTTTVASTMLRILFQYDTVWRCVGVA